MTDLERNQEELHFDAKEISKELGIGIGKELGIGIGIQLTKLDIAKKMLAYGYELDQVSSLTEIPIEKLMEINLTQ